ncbi:MAG: hypothetical protein ACI4JW_05295 [Oscillospiraceae bacterium]
MKKLVCLFLTAILFVSGAVTVFAAGPKEPVINSQMPDCYGVEGGDYITLFTDASSLDGGTLTYQWYSTTVNDISTIRAIDGATGTTYTPPQKVGVAYYCYAVWNTKEGITSSPVYSRLIRMEYEESAVSTVSIEILSTPDKVVYTSGECLDLTGLKVRIWTSDGYIDSVNGDKLEITKNPLVTVGEQKIKVAYGEAYDFFIVTVNEAAHSHSFGEWTVTTEPTCTESGIKSRECDCGHTERAEIAAKGHNWDSGKVTKEPTKTADGEKTFTCTVCGKTKTEVVKAGSADDSSDDSSDESSSESSDKSSKESKFKNWFKNLGSLKFKSDDSSQNDISDGDTKTDGGKSAKSSDTANGADSSESGVSLVRLIIAGGIGLWIIISIIIVIIAAKKDKKKRSQINGDS